jgi:hypothetical protein
MSFKYTVPIVCAFFGDRHSDRDQVASLVRIARRQFERQTLWRAMKRSEKLALSVVNPSLQNVRVRPHGIDIFLCGLAVIEGECGRRRRGKDFSLALGLALQLP